MTTRTHSPSTLAACPPDCQCHGTMPDNPEWPDCPRCGRNVISCECLPVSRTLKAGEQARDAMPQDEYQALIDQALAMVAGT